MSFSPIQSCLLALLCLAPIACSGAEGHDEEHEIPRKVVLTRPMTKEVVSTQQYVCQIHSRRHIELRALERGYLEKIQVQEGQAVKQGELLFKILPVVYKAKLHADEAELLRAEIELRNTKKLYEGDVVSDQELALAKAERARAKAKVELAAAELAFTEIRAPFDGIIDRQYEQQGSLMEEGDILTTVSDNNVMWVYFNVPEANYLEFKAIEGAVDPDSPQRLTFPEAKIELQLANGEIFGHGAGDSVTVESDFDNETGNILFRADFPNPDGLLRHGQTGTLLIHETLKGAIVIPQRATFEILDKQYVYVVGEDGAVHQRAITISHEMDDIFVVESGLDVTDKIVLDGVRQIHEGDHPVSEFREPEEVLSGMKHHAE
ncbi:Toluene efflux pump periplasmic linker protein TtgA precursor [Enhygromyxa salina]|uniref:Toluene efflux pump periplasmic linker protein TtgA n=1 Tax=Enhygromyxa salina TaxID=215803 RepID=A0A2S9XE93_9BACT|nr:efflux RND transporter periplasmic adaptor subunit [Enhygromyxa salina]PRP91182.1 Toluene efflux pump periplasmic linker protein TtgA precursor [Enhygromyxa salina]